MLRISMTRPEKCLQISSSTSIPRPLSPREKGERKLLRISMTRPEKCLQFSILGPLSPAPFLHERKGSLIMLRISMTRPEKCLQISSSTSIPQPLSPREKGEKKLLRISRRQKSLALRRGI
jgi:hypothetical protein